MKKRFTLVELMVALGIMSILVFLLMKLLIQDTVTFGELEKRLSSQADARISLELMYRDVAGAYRFLTLDRDKGIIEFVSAQEAPTELSESLRGENPMVGHQVDQNSLFLRVNKIKYYFKKKGKVTKKGGWVLYRKVTPGKYYLRSGDFVVGGSAGRKEMIALRALEKFDFDAFYMNSKGLHKDVNFSKPSEVKKASLLVLHFKMTKFEQDAGALEMKLKLYSRARVSMSLYPGYFNTIDRYTDF